MENYIMGYSIQEENELNNQLKKWQDKQIKAVRRKNFDYACEKMHPGDMSVWEIIANAESYKDVSNGAWDQAERVVDLPESAYFQHPLNLSNVRQINFCL